MRLLRESLNGITELNKDVRDNGILGLPKFTAVTI